MFNFEGFGQRLQQLRKMKKMSQEDLADRMGVSGQAVSKWETGLSYPDITTIPALVTILGTEIDYLFGKEKEIKEAKDFPDNYGGLPLVHSANGVACYSNKTVNSTDETSVKFGDGSVAELSTMLATNMGQGEIKFLNFEKSVFETNFDFSVGEKKFEFDNAHSVDIATIGCCDCKIVQSSNSKVMVTVNGESQLLALIKVEVNDGKLIIGWRESSNINMRRRDNFILVELPCDKGDEAKLVINGSGGIVSEISFKTGSLSINGSGTIRALEFDEACKSQINGSGTIEATRTLKSNININGSGNIDWKAVENAEININGSGNVSLAEARSARVRINGSGDVGVVDMTGGGDFTAKITGSGAIGVKNGSCEKFDVEIIGSSDVDATGLTARQARIILHQDGDVVLGRVLEGSTEQVKKKGTIRVLKRG